MRPHDPVRRLGRLLALVAGAALLSPLPAASAATRPGGPERAPAKQPERLRRPDPKRLRVIPPFGRLVERADTDRLAGATHAAPHTVLGPHEIRVKEHRATVIRAWHPNAEAAALLVEQDGRPVAVPMNETDQRGLFEVVLGGAKVPRYRLRYRFAGGHTQTVEDPYRFPSTVSAEDVWLWSEGSHELAGNFLGAHPRRVSGVRGFRFVTWAPNAQRVSVIGDFNQWDGRIHPMRPVGTSGLWELFLPGMRAGQLYKFELRNARGELAEKADPYARAAELRPRTASRTVGESRYRWRDRAWMARRGWQNPLEQPVSIYEVHLGSWRRGPEGRFLNYREIADQLVPYVKAHGFTHIEMLPLTEHPFDGSWGYQGTGYLAPTARHGSPDDLRYLVDRAHRAGIGVYFDWVPGHFAKDAHGLAEFDGTELYSHLDPRQGEHLAWGTKVFNYGRPEVREFLNGSKHFWMGLHADGLRVDGVASMLYLDYSREHGQWVPNQFGGSHNLEAIDFLRDSNQRTKHRFPDTLVTAEESTSFAGVTRSPEKGGLGFDLKWNMGFMNDTLRWFMERPEYRGDHLDLLTGTLLWAQDERHVLPMSHDEVVHGKRSLLEKMPGDDWQKHASLRLLYGYMWSYPGHKLLFMGGEVAQRAEWDHDGQIEQASSHYQKGVSRLVTDLNHLYRNERALWVRQFDPGGHDLTFRDHKNGVIGLLRRSDRPGEELMFVHNGGLHPHHDYRIGVEGPGEWQEVLNTDATIYGGSGVHNAGRLVAEPVPWHGKPYSLRITVPPMATLALKPAAAEPQPQGATLP
jgi:1,4-alpha-glucan branching enzyme